MAVREQISRLQDLFATPMSDFVRDACVGTAILINRRGQILGLYGFDHTPNLSEVAALGAAINASSRALARELGFAAFKHSIHMGVGRQLMVGSFDSPAGELSMLTVYDDRSSVGMVRLAYQRLVEEIQELAVTDIMRRRATSAVDVELELDASLDRFSRDNRAVP